jgi:hypothetical protein
MGSGEGDHAMDAEFYPAIQENHRESVRDLPKPL